MLLKKVAFDKVDNVLDVFQSRKKVVFEASYILFCFVYGLYPIIARESVAFFNVAAFARERAKAFIGTNKAKANV